MQSTLAKVSKLQPVRVQLDVLNDADVRAVWLPAFTTGQRWNGWATPMFDKATADRLVGLFNERRAAARAGTVARYDAERDLYSFEDEDGEIEEFGPEMVGRLKLYPIGASAWTWSAEGDFDEPASDTKREPINTHES